jgi:hypothetical protein
VPNCLPALSGSTRWSTKGARHEIGLCVSPAAFANPWANGAATTDQDLRDWPVARLSNGRSDLERVFDVHGVLLDVRELAALDPNSRPSFEPESHLAPIIEGAFGRFMEHVLKPLPEPINA